MQQAQILHHAVLQDRQTLLSANGVPDGDVDITPPVPPCAGVWKLADICKTLGAPGDWRLPWSKYVDGDNKHIGFHATDGPQNGQTWGGFCYEDQGRILSF